MHIVIAFQFGESLEVCIDQDASDNHYLKGYLGNLVQAWARGPSYKASSGMAVVTVIGDPNGYYEKWAETRQPAVSTEELDPEDL